MNLNEMTDISQLMEATGLSDDILKPAFDVWASKRGDLQILIRAGNLDPKNDFRSRDLRGWPLRGEDVRGIDFSYSDLRGTGVRYAVSDSTTLFNRAMVDDDDPEHSPQASDWALFNDHMSSFKDAALFKDIKLAQLHCSAALELAMLQVPKDVQWEWGVILASYEKLRLAMTLVETDEISRLRSILDYQLNSLSQSALVDNRALSFFVRASSLLEDLGKESNFTKIVMRPLIEVYHRVMDSAVDRGSNKFSSYNIFNTSKSYMRYIYNIGDHRGSFEVSERLIRFFEFQPPSSQNFDTFDFWLRSAELACRFHRRAGAREESLRYLRRAVHARLAGRPFGEMEEAGLRDLISVGIYAAVSGGGEFEEAFEEILNRVDRVIERSDTVSLLKRVRIVLLRRWKSSGISRYPVWKIRLLLSILRAEIKILSVINADLNDNSRFLFTRKFVNREYLLSDIEGFDGKWADNMDNSIQYIFDNHYKYHRGEDARLFSGIIDEARRLLMGRTGSFF